MRTQTEKEQYIAQAKIDRDAYTLALMRDNWQTGIKIEHKYGLYGYSPELVSVGLNAAVEGKDPEMVIETYIVDRMMGNN